MSPRISVFGFHRQLPRSGGQHDGSRFQKRRRRGIGEYWVVDLARGIRTRITFDPVTSDENPTWSPDGRFLAFASHRNSDRASIFKKASSGEGQDQPLFSDISRNPHPEDWSPDGKFLLVHVNDKLQDIFAIPLSGGEQKLVLL